MTSNTLSGACSSRKILQRAGRKVLGGQLELKKENKLDNQSVLYFFVLFVCLFIYLFFFQFLVLVFGSDLFFCLLFVCFCLFF